MRKNNQPKCLIDMIGDKPKQPDIDSVLSNESADSIGNALFCSVDGCSKGIAVYENVDKMRFCSGICIKQSVEYSAGKSAGKELAIREYAGRLASNALDKIARAGLS